MIMKRLLFLFLLIPLFTISCDTQPISELTSDLKKMYEDKLEESEHTITSLKQQVEELKQKQQSGDSSSGAVSNKEIEVSKHEIDGSLAEWFPDNEDQIVDAILAEIHLPIPKSIISNAVHTAIHTNLNTTIESIKFNEGDNRYSILTILDFPFSFDIPLGGKKSYTVKIYIDFIIEGIKIVSANINTSSIEEVIQNTNPFITMVIIPLERSGNTYRYRTILKEESGVDIHISALVREFIETDYVWTGGRDYLLDHVGGFTIPAKNKFEWETSFDLSEATTYFKEHGKITYRESWYGTDADGNAIGINFSISTDEFK